MGDRSERVILSLEGDYTTDMARAAAVTALLKHELNDLSGHAVRSSRSLDTTERSIHRTGNTSDRAGSQIDKLSGRVRLLAEGAAVLGPGFVTVGAIGIPALAGLAAQAGFAAIAGAALVGSFQGVGGALEALNTAHLEPTAENLAAAREAMRDLSPEARDFVVQLREMAPALKDLRDAGAAELFPGLGEGLDALESRLPDLERIMGAFSGELGDIAADSGESLASDRWDDFFAFLAEEGPSALADMAKAVGNVTHAATEMWMAFDPLNDDFSTWLVDNTGKLDDWATSLDQTEGFQEFVDYIRANGPQVGDTLGAIADAALQIVEATAPLGGPVLHGLEAVAKVIASIADSDLGTPIFTGLAAMSLYNRTLAVKKSLSEKDAASSKMFGAQIVGTYRAQLDAVKQLPAAYRDATTAHKILNASQVESRRVTAQYVGTLKASNTAVALGVPRSAEAHARLADSLDRVEMANYAVGDATEKARAAEARRDQTLRQSAAGIGKSIGLAAGLTVATSGMADGIGLSNTASLALVGTMAGPWGAAVGGAVGLLKDARDAARGYEEALVGMNEAAKSGDLQKQADSLDAFLKASNDRHSVSSLGDFISDSKKNLGLLVTDPAALIRDDKAVAQARIKNSEEQRFAYLKLGTAMKSLPIGESVGDTQLLDFATRVTPALDRLGVTAEELKGMDRIELAHLADQIREITGASDSAEGRTKALTDSLMGLDDGILDTARSASLFSSALQDKLWPALNAEAATDQYTQSLHDMRKALSENSAGFEGQSAAVRGNREVTRQWVGSLTDMLSKQAEAGASSQQIARRVNEAREAFVREGVAAGYSGREMRRRAQAMGLTPKLVRTIFQAAGLEMVSAKVARLNAQYHRMPKRILSRITLANIPKTEADLNRLDKKVGGLTRQQRKIIARLMDQTPATQAKILRNLKKIDNTKPKPTVTVTDKATPKLNSIQSRINGMEGKTIYIDTVERRHKASAFGNLFVADGMGYSYGDVANRHMPELAGSGNTRIWREPETMGEAYIPLANDDRRPLARSILEQTAALLGGSVDWRDRASENARRYAMGGITAPRVSVAAPEVSMAGAMAGARITAVFPGIGKVVGEIVDDRIAAHDDMAGSARRAGVRY